MSILVVRERLRKVERVRYIAFFDHHVECALTRWLIQLAPVARNPEEQTGERICLNAWIS